jgi:hypothetical protein
MPHSRSPLKQAYSAAPGYLVDYWLINTLYFSLALAEMKFACALVLLVVMYASASSAGPIPFEDIQDVEVRYCDFRTQYKSIQIKNLRTLQAYIFPHFTTFRNRLNFAILLILVCSFRKYTFMPR